VVKKILGWRSNCNPGFRDILNPEHAC